MANRTFSVSSNCLKSATVVLLIVLVIHIVGFSLPRWISVETTITEHAISLKTEAGYHAGLWQHCGCASFRDTGACLCFSRTNDPSMYSNLFMRVSTWLFFFYFEKYDGVINWGSLIDCT